MKIYLFVLLTLCIVSASAQQTGIAPYDYNIKKTFTGSNGAVVSASTIASQVGVHILQQGGNAVDAAIATQLALAVVYPGAGNIGGGGFMVAHLSNGKNVTIDFREKAPAKSSSDMYLDDKGESQLSLSQDGHLSAGVPGAIAGIFTAMKYAKLPFKVLIQPAIDLAEKGFIITESEARGLNNFKNDFIKYSSATPAFVKATPWKTGDTLVQTDLANTLKRIQAKGAKGFYKGATAKMIVAEMQKGKGIISLKDLKHYKAKERDAIVFDYKGYTIVTMPLPSSGGILLPMMMKMVENQPLASYGFQSLKAVHLMTEVDRLTYADRAKYLGDLDFYKVPVKTLTSDSYIAERMKLYNPDKAGNSKEIGSGIIPHESDETTHLDAYDKEGNAVSLTTTLNGGYGSRTVVAGAGFLLNNEMDDFSTKPGVPNMYGAVGGEANAIAPGKRMLSSMTPTIVLQNSRPYLVVGTPGGTTITTSVFQTLVNILDFNLSTSDAVNKPKFHHQWLPDELYIENGFPEAVIEQLKAMGYTIKMRGGIGRTEVIKIKDGIIEAVADGRGDDGAAGY